MITNDFINKAKLIHGDKYNYSLTNYINSQTKVKIICQIHGEFEQIPNTHLSGAGCIKCFHNNVRKSVYDIINEAKLVHGNKYDYSLVNYTNCTIKVKIICPIHGEFFQTLDNHLSGAGCSKCNIDKLKTNFINRAKLFHNNKYDYSLVNYKNYETKVKIICPVHGEFEQTPHSHIKCGCTKCFYDNIRPSTDDFINKAKLIHGDKYNYSLVDYVHSKKKVKIICPIHGEFLQKPNDHLNGYGCLKCGNKVSNTNDFINKARLIHNNKYDYSLVDYVHSKKKVKIICPIHGEFLQTPVDHLSKKGCRQCSLIVNISKGHQEIIDFVNSFGFNMLINDRDIIKPNELDIYIPEKKFAIEFHGIYYHSLGNNKYKHYQKAVKCLEHDIDLLQIFEDEWKYETDIMKSIILFKLGIEKDNYNYKLKAFKTINNKSCIDIRFDNSIIGKVISPKSYYVNNCTRSQTKVSNKIIWDAGYYTCDI